LSSARPGNNVVNRTPQTTARSNQRSQGRPPVSNAGTAADRAATGGAGVRTWSAQGNSTDRGTAPPGFGSNRSTSTAANVGSTQSARAPRSDRPPWAGSGSNGSANGSVASRSESSAGSRSYEPAARSYSAPSRSYSSPRSSYPSSRSYSAPSRSTSAPAHSTSGGGAPHGSGGSPHGGGGSHGGGHH
jgi:hypothetical protein